MTTGSYTYQACVFGYSVCLYEYPMDGTVASDDLFTAWCPDLPKLYGRGESEEAAVLDLKNIIKNALRIDARTPGNGWIEPAKSILLEKVLIEDEDEDEGEEANQCRR